MTAVTVGSTTDYTVDDPTHYSDINNQEPSSPTLSSTDLWLVDPTQLHGETTDTFFPEYSVTNLSETVDQSLIVPFENIDNEEPEITFGTLSTVTDDTFEVDDSTGDSIDTAVVSGNIDLASSSPSGSVATTSSQLTGVTQTASFSEAGGGTSGGGSGESLSQLSSGGSSGSGTGETDSSGGTTGDSGGTTTSSGDSGGTTTSSTGDSGGTTTNLTTTTDGTTAGETVATGSQNSPADVPFSLTESLGLGLLIGIVCVHKVVRQRTKKKLQTA